MSLGSNIILPNVRKFFLPDPGYILFDVDLAGADAQIVAWEANDEPLKQAFRAHAAGKGPKVHCVNARAIFGAKAGADGKTDPYYSRAKAGVHLCVADGHEALTPSGWIPVENISAHIPILACQMDGTEAHMEVPSSWYHAQDTIQMLSLQGSSYHQLVTPNHKLSYAIDSKGVRHETVAELLPRSARLPKACRYSGPVQIQADRLRLLCAFHADGSVSKKQVKFHFKKERKIARLLGLAAKLGVSCKKFDYADGTCNIVFSGFVAEWLIATGKAPTWSMLQYNGEALQAYVDELPFWDGWSGPTSTTFSTVNKQTAEIVQTLIHLRGQSGSINVTAYPAYNVQINNRPLSRIHSRESITYAGGIHCPTVSTGYWLTRYKGKIAVTGNTNYGGKARTCASALSISTWEAEEFQREWFRLHPAIAQWHNTTFHNLQTTRSVRNPFGFVRTYFDRIENLLPEALAWIPQSTVAIIIDHAYNTIVREIREAQVLLQVHDSLVGQVRIEEWPRIKPLLRKALEVVVPYDDPLIVPTGLQTSTKSWGDVQNESWD
jgi:hypothetical protein